MVLMNFCVFLPSYTYSKSRWEVSDLGTRGKSTLADRLLEMTGTVAKEDMKSQLRRGLETRYLLHDISIVDICIYFYIDRSPFYSTFVHADALIILYINRLEAR